MNVTNLLKKFVSKDPFQGVYQNYRDVPKSGPGHEGPVWLEQCRRRTDEILREQRRIGAIPSGLAGPADLLALLAAEVSVSSGFCRILDFGGGLGFTYLPLRERLIGGHALTYDIVEGSMLCAEGRTLFKDNHEIQFHEALPQDAKPDIVFIGSALQYVENYQELVKTLLKDRPRYFFLGNFSAALAEPTFATQQINIQGSTMPYWFISVGEIISLLTQQGYQLNFKSTVARIPPLRIKNEKRAIQGLNLIFGRTNEL